MTIDLNQYPKQWQIGRTPYKQSVQWKCEKCHKPCRINGESWDTFVARLPDYHAHRAQAKPKSYELHLAHLDQNPKNNALDNWMALCQTCHLEHDRPFIQRNRNRKQYRIRELNGQLSLGFTI